MQSPGKYHSINFFQTAILKENEKKLSDAQEELKQTKLKLNESSEKIAFLQSGENGTMHVGHLCGKILILGCYRSPV